MNKLEKVCEIIAYIVLGIGFLMIIWFITMFILLLRYDECYDNSFELPYCEKYKNF